MSSLESRNMCRKSLYSWRRSFKKDLPTRPMDQCISTLQPSKRRAIHTPDCVPKAEMIERFRKREKDRWAKPWVEREGPETLRFGRNRKQESRVGRVLGGKVDRDGISSAQLWHLIFWGHKWISIPAVLILRFPITQMSWRRAKHIIASMDT